MSLNVSFSRPVGVALVLGLVAATGGTAVALALANRAALIEERDAKAGFVARSLVAARGRGAAVAAPEEALAITAETGTLAAAQLDALVRSTVARDGGTVLSSRAEVQAGDASSGGDPRIVVEVSLQGRVDALQAALYRLESGAPLVLVDTIDVRVANTDEAAPGRAGEEPQLSATLTLTGFWAKPRS